MTLIQLNYVIEIANSGSINKASKNLFVSQSCISSAIHDLEDELGIHIFVRTNKGVEFTEEGREFHSSIRPIVEQQQRILRMYASNNTSGALKLSVSTQHYPFSSQAFVRFLNGVTKERYTLRLKETHIQDIIDDVDNRQSDVGILFMSKNTEHFIKKALFVRDLEFTLLKRVRPHAFLGTHHPLAKKTSLTVSELEKYPFAVFDQGGAATTNFSEEIVLTGFIPSQKTIYVFDRNSVYNVLSHSDAFSLGSGLLPRGYCDPDVVSVPIESPGDEMQLGWIKQKYRTLPAPALEYITLLERCLADE